MLVVRVKDKYHFGDTVISETVRHLQPIHAPLRIREYGGDITCSISFGYKIELIGVLRQLGNTRQYTCIYRINNAQDHIKRNIVVLERHGGFLQVTAFHLGPIHSTPFPIFCGWCPDQTAHLSYDFLPFPVQSDPLIK